MITIRDAQLRFNENHVDREGAPTGIILHHAATNGSVQAIHAYHRDENGWAGIGYHFYVTEDGVIWRGRPEQWLGAHTTGFNDRIGICAEGNFEESAMPAVQRKAIARLIAYLETTYGELAITRHGDHDATVCPGANFPFDEIVAAARAKTDPRPTEGLVLRFQRAAIADGLDLSQYGADGVWGLETAGAAAQLVGHGSTGERVKLVQELVGADVDGIFGDETLSTVKAFQAKNGLAVDGIVGVLTWKVLLGVTA